MASVVVNAASAAEYPALPAGYSEPRWYAAYTRAQHEKRVAQQLEVRDLPHYLPLYETIHRWKDRRKRVQLPLFPGYIFVRLAPRDRLRVLRTPGVVRLVSFDGHPAALPEEDIQAIRNCLGSGRRVEPHPYLKVGRRVRVKAGPLEGVEGAVVRRKNRTRFVISLDQIQRSLAVEVDEMDLGPAN